MDQVSAFVDVFVANGPRPELATELELFAPLIGSWDLRVFEYDADDSVTETTAEWHFSWALDGHAVADVWISPRRADRSAGTEGEWGLSLRFYDPKIQAWRSTWHGPMRGWVIPFLGQRTEEGIELRAQQDGVTHRWTFSHLTAESFRWRREEIGPDETVRLRQRFEAHRTGA
ncbi:hypothetical protein ACWDYH_12470 [Nocardia goodfellowii]